MWDTTARDMKMKWSIFASSFIMALNFLNFWMQQVSMSPDFDQPRQVSALLQPSHRHGVHHSAFLGNSTLHRVLNFFLPSLRFPCRCFEYPGFLMQSDGSRMADLARKLMSDSSPSASILLQSCLLLVLASSSPSFWCSSKLKFWAQQTELKWLLLHK